MASYNTSQPYDNEGTFFNNCMYVTQQDTKHYNNVNLLYNLYVCM